jgi:hypothetical protein
MKKILCILTVLGVVGFAGRAAAQEVIFVKPQFEPSEKKKMERKEQKIDEGSRTGGVIPRAVRSGNPLQLINPWAPAKYGNGSNMTMAASPQGSGAALAPLGGTGVPGAAGTETFKIFSWEF